jgi:uncharacterized protein with HEPN domain
LKGNAQRDRFLVSQILEHAEILAAIARKGKATLGSDDVSRYAAEHATELIAEAAEKVSQDFKNANAKIPWDQLRPLRHDVAHPYDLGAEPVNIDQLWLFVTRDAPRIARYLRGSRFPSERGGPRSK